MRPFARRTSHFVSNLFVSHCLCRYRYKDFFFAIIISSYFKIFLVCMMIWEFPSPVIFIIDLFVLSSNVIAIKGKEDLICP
ncbi:Protein arv1-like protein, partial [Cucurbita argyrosperma subsp. argyrosperma]